MAAAEVALNPPLIPLFKRGNFYPDFLNPSLEKRGRGDLWAQWRGTYFFAAHF
jgi:hypothetical protein